VCDSPRDSDAGALNIATPAGDSIRPATSAPYLQKEDMSDFAYLPTTEPDTEPQTLHVVTYRLTKGDVARATYAFNGTDPVSAVEPSSKAP